jgi:phospholipid-binding lipoprotein MlaA
LSLPAISPMLMALASPVAMPSATLADGSAIILVTAPPPEPIRADLIGPILTPVASAQDVTVEGAKPPRTPGDPLEGFNRRMFNAHQKFDRALLRPAAMGYKHSVPKPLRTGIRHVLSNLTEPIVFLNDLLQWKPARAIKTFGRFIFNSTLGLGGVLDIAKLPGLKLPHRPNGFGDTLGYYGVKPGPYLFLPFVGPTDLRDLFGGQADGLVLPLAVGHPFDQLKYQIPKGVVSGLDQRAEADQDLNALFGSAVDPYATLRSVYLQDRAGEIRALHGKPAAEAQSPLDTSLSDPLADPLADPGGAPAKPDATTPELQDPLADPATALAPSSDAPELSDPLSDPASGK